MELYKIQEFLDGLIAFVSVSVVLWIGFQLYLEHKRAVR